MIKLFSVMPYTKKSVKARDYFEIEEHPFDTFIPEGATTLIIGTFPTYRKNFRYNFFYSGQDNSFWNILEIVFDYKFTFDSGENAVQERKSFLESKKIGITDMLMKCYRKNYQSTDENLYPITLNNIFSLLDQNTTVSKLVLTSRTEVFGALSLLHTTFLNHNKKFDQPLKRADKILEGGFDHNNKFIKILVPYSPSPRVIDNGYGTKEELIKMYKYCLF